MKFNHEKYFDLEKKDFLGLPFKDKFEKILYNQVGHPYRWGKENREFADCSGSICFALMGAGFNIRTTADDLYKQIFTERYDPEKISALFFVTKKEQKHGSRMVPEGTATHIMGYVGDTAILNMTPPKAKLQSVYDAINWANKNGYTAVYRSTSKEILEKWSDKLWYGIDMELSEVFDYD